VREIAWKAQTRLCQRYRQMMARDKLKQVVCGFQRKAATDSDLIAATLPI
jgi:hypothetical protein